jgi:polysaccharide biosynthesis transport protein
LQPTTASDPSARGEPAKIEIGAGTFPPVNDTPRYKSLRDYLRVLREQWIVIAVITLVGGGAALFVSVSEDSVYEAVSAIAFEDETQQLGAALGGSVSPTVPVGKTPQARAQTVDEPAVLRRVARALSGGERISAARLQGAISTSLDEDSLLVDVTASWSDGDFAATLANEFAREAARYTNLEAQREYRSALEGVESRLESLGSGVADQTERAALTDQLTRLQFLAENAEPARIAETAQVPGAPTSPKTARNTALGILLGLTLGILAAFLRDALDRRLRGSRQVHDELGYPLLGHIRDDALGKVLRNGTDSGLQPDIEALRIIRQNLEFLSGYDQPPGTILVTSPLPEEGKSTVAAGLAFAIAQAGHRALLVEADLRRPELAQRLGLRSSPGLADFLTGEAEPQQVLQMVSPGPGHKAGSNGAARNPSANPTPLVCIVAGRPAAQPPELLGTERFELFIEQVAQVYDAVIIDASPLLPVADTLRLVPEADAVVLCVRSGQTTRDDAQRARSALVHAPGEHEIGLVVTGVQRRDERDYGYYSDAYTRRPGRGEKSKA